MSDNPRDVYSLFSAVDGKAGADMYALFVEQSKARKSGSSNGQAAPLGVKKASSIQPAKTTSAGSVSSFQSAKITSAGSVPSFQSVTRVTDKVPGGQTFPLNSSVPHVKPVAVPSWKNQSYPGPPSAQPVVSGDGQKILLLTKKYEESDARCKMLEAVLVRLDSEFELEGKKHKQTEDALRQEKRENVALKQEQLRLSAVVSTQADAIKRLEASLAAASSGNVDAATMSELTRQAQAKDQELSAVKAELQISKDDVARVTQEKTELDLKFEKLKQAVQDMTVENDKLVQDNRGLASNFGNVTKELEKCVSQKEELKKAHDRHFASFVRVNQMNEKNVMATVKFIDDVNGLVKVALSKPDVTSIKGILGKLAVPKTEDFKLWET